MGSSARVPAAGGISVKNLDRLPKPRRRDSTRRRPAAAEASPHDRRDPTRPLVLGLDPDGTARGTGHRVVQPPTVGGGTGIEKPGAKGAWARAGSRS